MGSGLGPGSTRVIPCYRGDPGQHWALWPLVRPTCGPEGGQAACGLQALGLGREVPALAVPGGSAWPPGSRALRRTGNGCSGRTSPAHPAVPRCTPSAAVAAALGALGAARSLEEEENGVKGASQTVPRPPHLGQPSTAGEDGSGGRGQGRGRAVVQPGIQTSLPDPPPSCPCPHPSTPQSPHLQNGSKNSARSPHKHAGTQAHAAWRQGVPASIASPPSTRCREPPARAGGRRIQALFSSRCSQISFQPQTH